MGLIPATSTPVTLRPVTWRTATLRTAILGLMTLQQQTWAGITALTPKTCGAIFTAGLLGGGAWTLGAIAFAPPARSELAGSETVLQKLQRTGILTAGTPKNAQPYAFIDDRGAALGYSIDMLERIAAQLTQDLGRPVRLELEGLAADAAIPALVNRQVDIICGATGDAIGDASSIPSQRDRPVEVSLSYGVTDMRLLLRRDSGIVGDPASLAGKRVAVQPQTLHDQALRLAQPEAQRVLFAQPADAYIALLHREIDAIATDGIWLEAWLSHNVLAPQFVIADPIYSPTGIACRLPKNNAALLNSVNLALTSFMEGVLNQEPQAQASFDRWFGDQSVVPLSQGLRERTLDNMRRVIDSREAPLSVQP